MNSLQVSDVISSAGRVRWLLVVLPLLAGTAALVVASDAAPDQETRATVMVLPPEGDLGGATVTPAVDGFRSLIVSDPVIDEAQARAGATGDVRVSAERIGTSNLVEVTVVADDDATPVALIDELVELTNDQMYAAPTAVLEARAARAESRFAEADAARRQTTRDAGVQQPVESYRAKASEVTQLSVAVATTAAVSGDGEAALRGELKRAEAELRELGRGLDSYRTVAGELERARTERQDVVTALDALVVRREAGSAPQAVLDVGTESTSSRALLARAGVAGAVAGGVAALIVVLAVGLLRTRPRRAGATSRTVTA